MYNVYGTLCGSYGQTCVIAGVETVAHIAASIEQDRQDYLIELQDDMEAWGSPMGLSIDLETGIVDVAPLNLGVNDPALHPYVPF